MMTQPEAGVTHSEKADAVYVRFQTGVKSARTQMLDDLRMADWAADGSLIGIEFLDVSGGIDLSGIPHRSEVECALEGLGFNVFA